MPKVTCTAPANTAGITIDDVQNQAIFTYATPTSHCTSCGSGTRSFYNSATDAGASDALNNNEAVSVVQCDNAADLCLCQSDGTCCTPTATAPDEVQLIPFCDNGVCSVFANFQGDSGTGVTCGGTTFAVTDSDTVNDGNHLMVDAVSCNGCNDIQKDKCTGPNVDGGTAQS
uniref:DUF281 domain-containing protein n=1 Tax=Bursaphelenchus xylophilus TaxID=6326 RepID=A0A1I7SH14_BURXY